MVRVGLVIEGAHDEDMLTPLIEGELRSRGHLDVAIAVVHPVPDETGMLAHGGWKRLRTWCQENGGANLETFFTPLFAHQSAYDVLVIHADGDCVRDICASGGGEPPAEPLSSGARVNLIADEITGWLAATGDHKDRIVPAIPVQSSEAWILAGEALMHDVETIDAKAEFRRTFSRDRHHSLRRFYQMRSAAVGSKTDSIAFQCRAFKIFRDKLCSSVGAVPTLP